MFKSLLVLSTFGMLTLHNASSIAAPVRVSQAGVDVPSVANNIYQMCKERASAVATLYSGAEIGTGSIISPNGLLITNYHVVQEAVQTHGKTKIYVKLTNGNRYLGQAIEWKQADDLAIVRLNTQEGLPAPIALAKGNVQLGEPVCAIGNPFGLTSVSVGTLKERRGGNDLKSNLFLIPGNSGGPLLNEQGNMIGVNKSIWLSETGENTGISFSTSSGVAQELIDKAEAYVQRYPINPVANAATLSSSDPSLQIANRPVASGGVLGAIVDAKSLIIRQIVLGSPADSEEGLRPGDRLLSGDRKPLKNLAALQAVLNRGQAILDFTVKRGQNNIPIRINFKQTTQQDRLK